MFGSKSSSKSVSGRSDSSISTDQRMAVLVVNGRRFPCRLDEITVSGFGVSIAWNQPWEGDPVAILQTRDSKYQVIIVKQEAEHGGFHLSLKRVDETTTNRRTNKSTWWITASVRSCAMGIAGIALIQYVANPHGFTRRAKQVSLKDVYNYWTFSFRPVIFDPKSKKPVYRSGSQLPYTSTGGSFDQSVEAVSVSMSSPPNVGASPVNFVPGGSLGNHIPMQPGTAPVVNQDPQAKIVAEATRRREVRESVATARREPMVRSNASSMSWLFEGTGHHPAYKRSYKISQSAEKDLTEFKQGLDLLPRQASQDAISSLLDTFARTTNPAFAATIEEIPGVKVIHSDDAAIYFSSSASGDVSILRVVPREIEKDTEQPTHR